MANNDKTGKKTVIQEIIARREELPEKHLDLNLHDLLFVQRYIKEGKMFC